MVLNYMPKRKQSICSLHKLLPKYSSWDSLQLKKILYIISLLANEWERCSVCTAKLKYDLAINTTSNGATW